MDHCSPSWFRRECYVLFCDGSGLRLNRFSLFSFCRWSRQQNIPKFDSQATIKTPRCHHLYRRVPCRVVCVGGEAMKSTVVKRSIVVAGHKTSVSLEDAFWQGLKQIAGERELTLSDLVATIDTERRQGNLSSAIRLFVLDYYQASSTARQSEMVREARAVRSAVSALRSE